MSEQQRLALLQELETFRYSWEINTVRLTELLELCENAKFDSSGGNNPTLRQRLSSCLIMLLGHSPSLAKAKYPVVVAKIERVFLRFATGEDIFSACRSWMYSRSDLLEDFIERQNWLYPDNWIKAGQMATYMSTYFILFSFKKGRLKDVADMLADKDFSNYSSAVANGLYHHNAVIRHSALTFCRQLDEPARNAVTKTLLYYNYYLHYGEVMDWLAEQKCYPASNNTVRVVVSLLNGVFGEYVTEEEPIIRLLFEIVQTKRYNERRVAQKAKAAILELRTAEGRNRFCELVLRMLKEGKSHKELEALAVEMNYTPPVTLDKILFFFLTRQFDKYDKLDFDRSVMYTFYSTTENKGLRNHINATVRESGRLDYLDIVTPRAVGVTDKSRRERDQQKTAIKVLRANGQWAQLWQKVFEFNLLGSVSAIGVLRKIGWQPADDYERELFARLTDIVKSGFINSALKIEPVTLLERPFGIESMQHLMALKTAITKKAELPPAEQNALSYIEVVLSYRFRHDIEVEFAPDVQPDRFDVELESD
jgi:hypothetical protein